MSAVDGGRKTDVRAALVNAVFDVMKEDAHAGELEPGGLYSSFDDRLRVIPDARSDFMEGPMGPEKAATFRTYVATLQQFRRLIGEGLVSNPHIRLGEKFAAFLDDTALPALSVFGGRKHAMLARVAPLQLSALHLVGISFRDLYEHMNIGAIDVSGSVVENGDLTNSIWTRLEANGTTFRKSHFDRSIIQSGGMRGAVFSDSTIFGTEIAVTMEGSDVRGLIYDSNTKFVGFSAPENHYLVKSKAQAGIMETHYISGGVGRITYKGPGPFSHRPEPADMNAAFGMMVTGGIRPMAPGFNVGAFCAMPIRIGI